MNFKRMFVFLALILSAALTVLGLNYISVHDKPLAGVLALMIGIALIVAPLIFRKQGP